jgi:hypothetical protein
LPPIEQVESDIFNWYRHGMPNVANEIYFFKENPQCCQTF